MKGATGKDCFGYNDSEGFNPRAREGRDGLAATGTVVFTSFNPRAREGRDLSDMRMTIGLLLFQSTRP